MPRERLAKFPMFVKATYSILLEISHREKACKPVRFKNLFTAVMDHKPPLVVTKSKTPESSMSRDINAHVRLYDSGGLFVKRTVNGDVMWQLNPDQDARNELERKLRISIRDIYADLSVPPGAAAEAGAHNGSPWFAPWTKDTVEPVQPRSVRSRKKKSGSKKAGSKKASKKKASSSSSSSSSKANKSSRARNSHSPPTSSSKARSRKRKSRSRTTQELGGGHSLSLPITDDDAFLPSGTGLDTTNLSPLPVPDFDRLASSAAAKAMFAALAPPPPPSPAAMPYSRELIPPQYLHHHHHTSPGPEAQQPHTVATHPPQALGYHHHHHHHHHHHNNHNHHQSHLYPYGSASSTSPYTGSGHHAPPAPIYAHSGLSPSHPQDSPGLGKGGGDELKRRGAEREKSLGASGSLGDTVLPVQAVATAELVPLTDDSVGASTSTSTSTSSSAGGGANGDALSNPLDPNGTRRSSSGGGQHHHPHHHSHPSHHPHHAHPSHLQHPSSHQHHQHHQHHHPHHHPSHHSPPPDLDHTDVDIVQFGLPSSESLLGPPLGSKRPRDGDDEGSDQVNDTLSSFTGFSDEHTNTDGITSPMDFIDPSGAMANPQFSGPAAPGPPPSFCLGELASLAMLHVHARKRSRGLDSMAM